MFSQRRRRHGNRRHAVSHPARGRQPHGVTPTARDLYEGVRDQAFHQGGGRLVHLVPVAELNLAWYDDFGFAFARDWERED